MKKPIFLIVFLLMGSLVLADTDMMGFGMMEGGMFGMGLVWLIYIAIASFIFSIIFWLSHNWIVKEKKR